MNAILNKLQSIPVIKPEDQVIGQIQELIRSGDLRPGDKLPPERVLAESFGIGRGYIRRALQKLDFYGVIKTQSQSGSYVSNIGVTIIDGLLSNILTLEDADMDSLLDARLQIEPEIAGLAAERAGEEGIDRLKVAFDKYARKINEGGDAMEEDILFHLRIAEAAGNVVLRSIIMILTQDIIQKTREIEGCEGGRESEALEEHCAILEAIEKGKREDARAAMRLHLDHTKRK
ncbi:MAG: FadR family transcriptional regulator [Prolixibacteraceae bacterium]|nr:FadR family transcriptional regulator [Prolixibacteraceae bacterium]